MHAGAELFADLLRPLGEHKKIGMSPCRGRANKDAEAPAADDQAASSHLTPHVTTKLAGTRCPEVS